MVETGSPADDGVTRCQPWLGTFVEITVPASAIDRVEMAFAAIRHVHERMSFHADDSDLARLRAAVSGQVVRVDRETCFVLSKALDLYRASGGLFDVGVGARLARAGFLPAKSAAGDVVAFGTCADIEIVGEDAVLLRRPVLIDLGGIAKGHAVDRAIAVLREADVPAACVNAGGDLRVFGACGWPIGLRDADGVVRQHLSLTEAAIASSANLLDRREAEGREWSPHIGAGGVPVLCDERVTVIADTCLLADAMTKIALADRGLAAEMLRVSDGEMLWESDMRGNG